MNKVFKLISNRRTGALVVASEHATGAKKGKTRGSVVAASSLLALSLVGGMALADITLKDEYFAAELIKWDDLGSHTKPEASDPTNPQSIDNHQQGAAGTRTVDDGGTHNVDLNYSATQINNDGYSRNVIDSQPFDELWDIEAVKAYNYGEFDEDNPDNNKLAAPPEWVDILIKDRDDDYELEPEDRDLTVDFTFEDPQPTNPGDTITIQVYDPDKIIKELTMDEVDYSREKLIDQPEIPFYDFTFAKTINGTLNFEDGQEADWKFDSIKQSHLFIADSTDTNAEAKLQVEDGAKLHAEFGRGTVFSEIESTVTTVGPMYTYADEVTIDIMDPVTQDVSQETFTIQDKDGFIAYNEALKGYIENHQIDAGDYVALANSAFKEVDDSEKFTLYYEYDPDLETDYLIPPEVSAGHGLNSILYGKGDKASVDMQSGSDLRAKYGYIVHLEKGADATHDTQTAIVAQGGNAYVDDSTYTNSGTLVFGYDSKDGSWDGEEIHAVWSHNKGKHQEPGDVVTGADGSYINTGEIFVAGKGADENYKHNATSAINIKEGATATNEGTMYIGSADTDVGLSRGANLIEGTFINEEDGKILVGFGKDKDADGNLTEAQREITSGDNADGRFAISQTNNAIQANLRDDSTKSVTIENKGEIRLGGYPNEGKTLNNAAAINVEYAGREFAGDAKAEDVTIKNTGNIFAGGQNTVGIKAQGYMGDDTKSILNTGQIDVLGAGSVGIVAASDATVYNEGEINVGDENYPLPEPMPGDKRRYGVRADAANIVLTGDSEINLNDSNVVGVAIRNGGTVTLDGVEKIDSTGLDQDGNPFENQTHYWISGYDSNRGTSKIEFGPGDLDFTLGAKDSTIFRVDKGADFGATPEGKYTFTVEGEGSNAFYVADRNTTVKTDGDMTIEVAGKNATGIYVTSEAGTGATGEVFLDKETKVSLTGEGATAILIDGTINDKYGNPTNNTGEAKATSEAKLSTGSGGNVSEGAMGYKLVNEGALDHQGEIDFTEGTNGEATGVYVDGGKLDNSSNASIKVDGIGVDIHQENAAKSEVNNTGSIVATDGTAAIRINKEAELNLGGAGSVTGDGTADAVRIHAGGTLHLDDADNITVKGTDGAGLHFLTDNIDPNEDEDIFTLDGTGIVTVDGNAGNTVDGIRVQGQESDGTPGVIGNASFDSTNSGGLTLEVNNSGGNGIRTNITGDVRTGTHVNINSEDGGSALIVEGGTDYIENTGNLTSQSTVAPVVDLRDLDHEHTFTNSGDISAKSKDEVAVHGTSGTTFNNTGDIQGTVLYAAGNENSEFNLYGGSKGNAFVSEGTGDDVFNLIDIDGTTTQSNQLFDSLDAGGGDNNTLVLKTEKENESHFIFNDTEHEINNFEKLVVENNATFEVSDSSTFSIDGTDSANIEVQEDGTFFVNRQGENDTFNHKIAGEGTLHTNLNGGEFNFTEGAGDYAGEHFEGTLDLESSKYIIDEHNETALTHATLNLNTDGHAIVNDKGDDAYGREIGGLTFDGGLLEFEGDILKDTERVGNDKYNLRLKDHLVVNTLDYKDGSGKVQVSMGDELENLLEERQPIDSTKNVLQQDDANTGIQLVAADNVENGNHASSLDFVDQDGNKITDAEEIWITQWDPQTQQEVAVARGTYDFGLSAEVDNEKGLFVTYKLEQVELRNKQGEPGDALTLDNFEADPADIKQSTLEAKVTDFREDNGTFTYGDLIIQAKGTETDEAIILANINNDYHGKTIVESGKLLADGKNTLGYTSDLILEENTKAENVGEQTIGQVTVKAGAEATLMDVQIGAGAEDADGSVERDGNEYGVLAEGNGATANITTSTIETSSNGAHGLFAVDAGSVITTNETDITTKGTNARGAYAKDGGYIELIGGSVITESTHKGSSALFAEKSGTIKATDVTLESHGGVNRAELGTTVKVITGGEISIERGTVFNDSDGGLGLFALDGTITATDVKITTTGTVNVPTGAVFAYGMKDLYASTIILKGGTVSTTGDYSNGIHAEGVDAIIVADNGVDTDGLVITTTGISARGAVASNMGILDLTNVVIATDGEDAYGAYAVAGGHIELSGGSVTTSGVGAHGLVADNARNSIVADGTDVTTSADDADGARARNGGRIFLSNNEISTGGANAHGLVVEGELDYIETDNTIVKTAQADAHGVNIMGDSTVNPAEVRMQGGYINAAGHGVAFTGSSGVFNYHNNLGLAGNTSIVAGFGAGTDITAGKAAIYLKDDHINTLVNTYALIENGAKVYGGEHLFLDENIYANNLTDGATLVINAGADIAGDIKMSDEGSDDLILNGDVDLTDVDVIDGGDDYSASDGFFDTVHFNGLNDDLAGSKFINWEKMNLNNSSVHFTDQIEVGVPGEDGTGLYLNNSTIRGGNSFDLTGNMEIDSTSTFKAGNGPGVYTVEGNVRNAGLIDLDNDGYEDTFTIDGDYVGDNGTIRMNTLWNGPGDDNGANSQSDVVEITGSASGNTSVVPVSITTGQTAFIDGDITMLGSKISTIPVIKTGQSTDTAFSGVANTTGAGQAQLVKRGEDWVWEINYAPSTSGYVQMSRVNREMGFEQLGKLHDRVGEQQTYVWDCCGSYGDFYQSQKELGINYHPIWVRGSLGELKEQGRERFGYKSKQAFIQIGSDLLFRMKEDKSHQHFGVMASYSHGKTDFYDKFNYLGAKNRTEKGTTDMFTLGAYNTWYKPNGAYLDLVGQISYIRNKYSDSSDVYDKSQNGYGFGLSAEVGRPFKLGNSLWLLEPQAQLAYQYVKLSSFNAQIQHTNAHKHVSGQSDGTLRGRVGLRLARNWDNGKHHTNTFYVAAHLHHDFTGSKAKARIGGDSVEERYGKTWGELQIGTQIATSKSSYLYGNVSYERSLGGNSNDVYRGNKRAREGVKGYIGVRFNF